LVLSCMTLMHEKLVIKDRLRSFNLLRSWFGQLDWTEIWGQAKGAYHITENDSRCANIVCYTYPSYALFGSQWF
jgi:hypothetical protein